MFAAHKANQARKPAEAKPKRADAPLNKKPSPQINPVWQTLALNSTSIQPKLAISQPTDPSEQEADQVADRVMRMATLSSSDSRPSLSPYIFGGAQRKAASCPEEKLQRKEQSASDHAVDAAPPMVHETLSLVGQPLDADTRTFMEPRFGHDFSEVRVHDDAAAAASASAVRATAYTLGSHIVFGAGQYAPRSPEGRRLLAHELAHVVQQPGGVGSSVGQNNETRSLSQNSDSAAVASPSAAHGIETRVPTGGATISRQPVGGGGSSGGGGASGSFGGGDSGGGSSGSGGSGGGGGAPTNPSILDTEVVELRHHPHFRPSPQLAAVIDAAGDAGVMVGVRYGSVAEGRIRVWRPVGGDFETVHSNRPTTSWVIHLHHPGLLTERGPEGGDPHSTESALGLRIVNGIVMGHVDAVPRPAILTGTMEAAAWRRTNPAVRMLGWTGFESLYATTTVINELRGGILRYQLPNFSFALNNIFDGSGHFNITDLGWRFDAQARVHVQGLADARLNIHRDEHGHIFGDAQARVTLRHFSGNLRVVFGEGLLDIRGTVRYAHPPTLSGELTLIVTDLESARNAAQTRIAAARPTAGAGSVQPAPAGAGGATTPTPGGGPTATAAGGSRERGITGWGVLDYHFNRWLTGRAEVIVSPDGYITSVAEIRPTAEVPFLDPPRTKGANIVPKHRMSVPAFSIGIASLGVGGSLQLDAQGALGPGRLHNMAASGMFSTDPSIPTELDITAMMSLSALARLVLHIEGYVGVIVADHPVGTLGLHIRGDATLRAHVDVQPRIQRRPTGGRGNPSSEWVLEGTLTAGAELSLGLSGRVNLHALVLDLHVVDLGSKRWSLGSVGIQAHVSYVIGSGQRPELTYDSISFPDANFIQAALSDEPLDSGPTEAAAAQPTWLPEGAGPAQLPPTAGQVAAGTPPPATGTVPAQPPAQPQSPTPAPAAPPPDAGATPPDAGATPSTPPATGTPTPGTGTPATTTPPTAPVPQPIVAHPVMSGTTHILTLTVATPPVLMFESDPGFLTAKIRLRIRQLTSTGSPAQGSRLAAQISALNVLLAAASHVEREAAALEAAWRRQGSRPPASWQGTRSVPGFTELATQINDYAAQFNENDILPYIQPTAPPAPAGPAVRHREITTLTNVNAEIAAADVLPRYNVGAGFSGAYNPATGQWIALASGNATLVSGDPVQTVDQYGGHGAAEDALTARTGIRDRSRNVGFVLVWQGNNTVRILWNSRTINERNFNDRAAPDWARAPIREAIARETGFQVID